MSKVVHLRPSFAKTGPDDREPVQLKLFFDESWTSGIVGYLDVEAIGQPELLSFIAEHSIRQVLDIRKSAAFPKSKFRHKEIFDYFLKFRIQYVDCYECARSIHKTSPSIFVQQSKLNKGQKNLNELETVPSVVIFNSSDGAAYLEGFRALFPSTIISSRLLNPSKLQR